MNLETSYVLYTEVGEGEDKGLFRVLETKDYGIAAAELARQGAERNLRRGIIVEVKKRIIKEVVL